MQISTEKIWASAQEILRAKLSADIYNLWFAPLRAVAIDDDSVTLEVANDFCEVWLKDNYVQLLQDVVTHAAGRALRVKFKVATTTAATPSTSHAVTAKTRTHDTRSVERAAVPADANFNPRYTFET